VKKTRDEHRARPADGIGTRHEVPAESPGFVLWQVATIWQRAIKETLAEVALTHAQFVLLASAGWLQHNADNQPVTQAMIAAHARTDAVMTSEVLRTLERKRLLKRLPHPEDARARQVVLTPRGVATARRAIELVEATDDAFFGTPGPELRALARLLRGTERSP
jgi:DNA-binding MarR family transcriptional regulator